MTGTAGPLGRESMSFRDKMVKYHAEIERLVYAAEVLCDSPGPCDPRCPFQDEEHTERCNLGGVRHYIGDHVDQHVCSECGKEYQFIRGSTP